MLSTSSSHKISLKLSLTSFVNIIPSLFKISKVRKRRDDRLAVS